MYSVRTLINDQEVFTQHHNYDDALQYIGSILIDAWGHTCYEDELGYLKEVDIESGSDKHFDISCMYEIEEWLEILEERNLDKKDFTLPLDNDKNEVQLIKN